MWCLPMSHHFLITIVLYLSQGATIILARHVLARFRFSKPSIAGKAQSCMPRRFITRCWRAIIHVLGFHRSGWLYRPRAHCRKMCRAIFKNRFNLPLIQGLGIIELGLVSLNTADPGGAP